MWLIIVGVPVEKKGEAIKVLAVGNLFALLTSFGAMKGNMHLTSGLIKTYATPPKNQGRKFQPPLTWVMLA